MANMKLDLRGINGFQHWIIALILLCTFIHRNQSAPAIEDEDIEGGCYYMFNHYGEGDRIFTNEPCLNCTCHNSMLMCYLRVCPFTKPIGQECTVEKKTDQCCPVITCPQVPVLLLQPLSGLTATSTAATTLLTAIATGGGSMTSTSTSTSTELALPERGCQIDEKYYADGAQVDSDPSKPCELCYCIRNRTACVIQECILHVEGCTPIFEDGVCCPVRYQCDLPPEIEATTLSALTAVIGTTLSNLLAITGSSSPSPPSSSPSSSGIGCYKDGDYYPDGVQIQGRGLFAPCEHCYCMRGEIVCAVQECGAPLENEDGNCTAIPPRAGLCCPEKYACYYPSRMDRQFNLKTNVTLSPEVEEVTQFALSTEALFQDGDESKVDVTEGKPFGQFETTEPSKVILENNGIESSTKYYEPSTVQEEEKLVIALGENYGEKINPSSEETLAPGAGTTIQPSTNNEPYSSPAPLADSVDESVIPQEQGSEVDLATNEITAAQTIIAQSTEAVSVIESVTESKEPQSIDEDEDNKTQLPDILEPTGQHKPGHSQNLQRDPTEKDVQKVPQVLEITTQSIADDKEFLKPADENLNVPAPENLMQKPESSSSPVNQPLIADEETTKESISHSGQESHADDKDTEGTEIFPQTTQSILPIVDHTQNEIADESSTVHHPEVVSETIITTFRPTDNEKDEIGSEEEGGKVPVGIVVEETTISKIIKDDEEETAIVEQTTAQALVEQQQTSQKVEMVEPEVVSSSSFKPEELDVVEQTTVGIITEEKEVEEVKETEEKVKDEEQQQMTTVSQDQVDEEENIVDSTTIKVTEVVEETTVHDREKVGAEQMHVETIAPVEESSLPASSSSSEPTVEITTSSDNIPEATTVNQGETEEEEEKKAENVEPVAITSERPENIENVEPQQTTTHSSHGDTVKDESEEVAEGTTVKADSVFPEEKVQTTTVVSKQPSDATTIPSHVSQPVHQDDKEDYDQGEKDADTTAKVTEISEVQTEPSTEKYFSTSEASSSSSSASIDSSSTVETSVESESSGGTQEEIGGEDEDGSISSESASGEDLIPPASSTTVRVPGEGSCYVEGITYRSGSRIPPSTPCQKACACQNSIVHCLLVYCPPPPESTRNCKAVYESGVCCPKYNCPEEQQNIIPNTPEEPRPIVESLIAGEPHSNNTSYEHENEIEENEIPEAVKVEEKPLGVGDVPSDLMQNNFTSDKPSLPNLESTPLPLVPLPPDMIISTSSSTNRPESLQIVDQFQDKVDQVVHFPPLALFSTSSSTSSTTESSNEANIDNEIHPSGPASSIINGDDQIENFENELVKEQIFSEPSSSTTYRPTKEEILASIRNLTESSSTTRYPMTMSTTPSPAPIWSSSTSMTTTPHASMSNGACLFDGRVYMSAQQIPRDDPCDFCFCFRGDIICLQQSCPPPIHGCYEEPIPGFCCPRYECPVGSGNSSNSNPTPLPPTLYSNSFYYGTGTGASGPGISMNASGGSGDQCEIQGEYYETGQIITATSGPCLECRCGLKGVMECNPRVCQPEPMLRKVIAEITSR